MSYPNLLEYHLLSSCPLMDSSPSVSPLQRRFTCVPRYLGCPKYFYSDTLTNSFTNVVWLLRCLKSFRYLLSVYFSLKSASLFHLGFSRCATVFQPEDTLIIQRTIALLYKDLMSKLYSLTAVKTDTRFHEGLSAEFTSAV